MELTKSNHATILQGVRRQSLTQEQLADAIGMSRSWVAKLLNGNLETLKESHARKLENTLQIELGIFSSDSDLSKFAHDFALRMDNSPALTKMIESILDLIMERDDIVLTPPYIPTEKMAQLGEDIAKIVNNAGVDSEGNPKFGKIARQVLELLA